MKRILSLIIIFIGCLGTKVYAEVDCNKYACATCVYSDEKFFKFTYDLKSSGDGSAELKFNSSVLNADPYGKINYTLTQSLSARKFIDSNTNKLFCPEIILVKISAGANNIVGEIVEKTEDKDYIRNGKLITGESSNNNLLVSSNGSAVSRSCSYDFNTITGNNSVKVTISLLTNGELKYELSDGYKINTNNNNFDITSEDFATSCPDLNGQCGSYGDDKYCSVTKNGHFDVLDRDIQQSGEEETEYDVTRNTDYDDIYSKVDSDTPVNCGTLGLLRDDLQGIFKVFKIVAPIFVIIFSTYDFIKAITGKVEGEMKKAFTKLLKRLLFAVILFFLPNILDWFLGLISEDYSTCIRNI